MRQKQTVFMSLAEQRRKAGKGVQHKPAGYDGVLAGVVELLDAARRASARVVDSLMTATYWEIGRRIVDHEQAGKERAAYGEEILTRLSADLKKRFGRGFSVDNLERARKFYLTFASAKRSATALRISASSAPAPISATALRKFQVEEVIEQLRNIAECFPLPWSHYTRLLRLRSAYALEFYHTEAVRGGWTVKQLERQMNSQFYERTALSQNKAAMLLKGQRRLPQDKVSADEEIRNPFLLEFLGLKDEYSERDLEEALIRHLEKFLLELGNDFAFVGRQRRLRIGHEWFRVDLLLFHRRLRCVVIVDLKIGALVHGDIGQMNLYCNYARAHWTQPDEYPPVGLILCTQQDEALARYALGGLHNKMLVREYLTALPAESELAREVNRARKTLVRQVEARRVARGKSR
jgi:predicted nuclease of restriction endonuclease-like (RecB) superfamily